MKTHPCKNLLRPILLVGLGLAVWGQHNPSLVAQTGADRAERAGQSGPARVPSLKITIDTSKAPEMAEWAAQAKSICEKSYPIIWAQLGSPGYQPPAAVKIVFENKRGVAYTAGGQITCCADWFKQHPDDYGAVVHELCHVVQSYGGKRVPGWVTEGIADYVRWFKFEPAERRPHVDPRHAKYTDGYQTTAAFFDWIVRTKNKSFVQRLNTAARNGKYSDDLFRQYAHKPLDKLWAEFIGALKK